jgi:hypothetical protein
MALPLIGQINQAALFTLAALCNQEYTNPENPSLDFLIRDVLTDRGYTEQNPLPIKQNVLTMPIAAPRVSPRGKVPMIDGKGQVLSFVKSFPLKIPLHDVTMDEYERMKLTSAIFGQAMGQIDPETQAVQAWQARMQLGKQALNNAFEVSAMNLIESASIIVSEEGALEEVQTFDRKAITATTKLGTNDTPFVDFTASGMIGLRWVQNDGVTINASAKPFVDIQAMIGTSKRYGAGGVKHFVMDTKSYEAYVLDFETNYKNSAIKTLQTIDGNASMDVPDYLKRVGWSKIGYVHDRSNAWALIPVYAGTSVKYRNWFDAGTDLEFVPTYPHCFPVCSVPTIARQYTWVQLERVRNMQVMFPVNIYEESESGAREGSIMFRGFLYPNLSPNTLIFYRTG